MAVVMLEALVAAGVVVLPGVPVSAWLERREHRLGPIFWHASIGLAQDA
jgi:hypothetical protein